MTADVELLPLPDGWNARILNEWGRANVAHATAAKDAEIEALRAEVGRLNDLCDGLHRSLNDSQVSYVYYRDRAERLAEAINAVLADMSEWGEPAKGAHILRVINFLSMALHPTAAQENGK